jgi:uncharacterized membrane protein
MPEMGLEAVAPEVEGGPGFDGGPEFALELGDDPEATGGPEGPGRGMGLDQELGAGPAFRGAPGFGQPPGPFGPRPGRPAFGSIAPPPGEALQALLGLNDEQVRSLRQMQREKAGKLDEARLRLRQNQRALLDLLEEEEPDGNALVSTVKSIHALRKQAGEIETEFETKTTAILSDEQKAKLKSLQESLRIPRAMQDAARFDLVRPMGMVPGGHVPQR